MKKEIENDREWRCAWELLQCLEEIQAENMPAASARAICTRATAIRDLKRKIRAYNAKPQPRALKQDFDECVFVVEAPATVITHAQAVRWFLHSEWYNPPVETPWGCTGRTFTTWFRAVHRSKKFYVYFCNEVDC